jgi:hypothetical protein
LQQIGEGGFGIIYMAEQDQPVHRRVAVKIITPCMDAARSLSYLLWLTIKSLAQFLCYPESFAPLWCFLPGDPVQIGS